MNLNEFRQLGILGRRLVYAVQCSGKACEHKNKNDIISKQLPVSVQCSLTLSHSSPTPTSSGIIHSNLHKIQSIFVEKKKVYASVGEEEEAALRCLLGDDDDDDIDDDSNNNTLQWNVFCLNRL